MSTRLMPCRSVTTPAQQGHVVVQGPHRGSFPGAESLACTSILPERPTFEKSATHRNEPWRACKLGGGWRLGGHTHPASVERHTKSSVRDVQNHSLATRDALDTLPTSQ